MRGGKITTKQEFNNRIQQGILFLDGATGSNLQKKGMPARACTEKWVCDHEEALIGLQTEYIEVGSGIIYASTFSANRIHLKEYGLEGDVFPLNKKLIQISKKAAIEKALVAGDITMTGRQLAPLGSLQLEGLIDVYREQIQALDEAGADLLVIETMMSLQETRAALIAAKEVSELPVMVTMSFGEDGRTLYGTDAQTAAIVLASLGAEAVGMNCSAGPDKMLPLVKAMKQVTELPIIAKPNAGMPKIGLDGKTEYDMDADTFALHMKRLVEAGASIIGGCCGTTPEYICAVRKIINKNEISEVGTQEKSIRVTSERKTILLQKEILINEINSKQNAGLAKEWEEDEFDTIYDLIDEYTDDETDIINICVDGNAEDGEDGIEVMKRVLSEVTGYASHPLMLESEHEEILETALRHYPGKACINSRSGDKEVLENLSKKYGAVIR